LYATPKETGLQTAWSEGGATPALILLLNARTRY
jgi:hypothetical protein